MGSDPAVRDVMARMAGAISIRAWEPRDREAVERVLQLRRRRGVGRPLVQHAIGRAEAAGRRGST